MTGGTPLRGPWNAALALAQAAGYGGARLDVDTLLARARRNTRLDDFGDPEFMVPLRLLLDDFAAHAQADATGRQVFASLLNCALENRLRITAWQRRWPGIATTPIAAPMVIVGMPRTGTTLLQNLLAAIPGLRTPLGWETRLPALPPAHAPARMLAAHRRRHERDMQFARRVSPRLMASHAFGAELPEECNPLLLNSFRLLATCVFPAPAHEDFLYATRFRGAYDWHRPHLAALAFDQPPCTWVLKAPAHMASLPELLRIYPDARVVFTHRDAAAAAPSTAGLALGLRALVSPVQDRREIGERVLAMLVRMQSAARAARAEWPAATPRLCDVDYDALVAAPLATVRGILAHFAMEEPAGAADAVLRSLRRTQRGRVPSARYSCAEFGFDEDAARAALPPLAAGVTQSFHEEASR